MVQVAIEANYVDLAFTEGGRLWIAVFTWFVVGWTLFMFVSIWRSAGKYNGWPGWAILARVAVVVGAMTTASNILG